MIIIMIMIDFFSFEIMIDCYLCRHMDRSPLWQEFLFLSDSGRYKCRYCGAEYYPQLRRIACHLAGTTRARACPCVLADMKERALSVLPDQIKLLSQNRGRDVYSSTTLDGHSNDVSMGGTQPYLMHVDGTDNSLVPNTSSMLLNVADINSSVPHPATTDGLPSLTPLDHLVDFGSTPLDSLLDFGSTPQDGNVELFAPWSGNSSATFTSTICHHHQDLIPKLQTLAHEMGIPHTDPIAIVDAIAAFIKNTKSN